MDIYKEVLSNLDNDFIVSTEPETVEIFHLMYSSIKFGSWGRIDWDELDSEKYTVIGNTENIIKLIKKKNLVKEKLVYVSWFDYEFKTILCDIENVLEHIDIISFYGDTWLFSPNEFIIEFDHDENVRMAFF
jgi:hypothetical protein